MPLNFTLGYRASSQRPWRHCMVGAKSSGYCTSGYLDRHWLAPVRNMVPFRLSLYVTLIVWTLFCSLLHYISCLSFPFSLYFLSRLSFPCSDFFSFLSSHTLSLFSYSFFPLISYFLFLLISYFLFLLISFFFHFLSRLSFPFFPLISFSLISFPFSPLISFLSFPFSLFSFKYIIFLIPGAAYDITPTLRYPQAAFLKVILQNMILLFTLTKMMISYFWHLLS